MNPPSPSASLAEFTAALFSSGQVAVVRAADLSSHEPEVLHILEAAFAHQIDDLPGTGNASLTFVPGIALTSTRCLYRLCLALIDRAMSEEEALSICDSMPPAPVTPDEVLSADLAFRHLPAIYQMARTMSETDPLVIGLQTAALRFPLSSLGIPLPETPDHTLLQRHDSLWRLYLDRVLECQDESRLTNSAVSTGIRDALGMHASLAPKLNAQLALAGA